MAHRKAETLETIEHFRGLGYVMWDLERVEKSGFLDLPCPEL